MNSMFTFGLIISGVAAFGGLIFWAALRSKKREGVLEERNAETQRQNEAKARADSVLAEHRDPDGVSERLRRGDF